MIRPRAGDLVYSDEEIDVMNTDIDAAKSLGADHVVLGLLCADDTIDLRRVAMMIDIARPMRVTFHRAFDRTPDAAAALDTLLALGVDNLLSSGQENSAEIGAQTLRRLQERAGAALVVMAGGGVRAHNVSRIVDIAGVREVHASATNPDTIRALVLALSGG